MSIAPIPGSTEPRARTDVQRFPLSAGQNDHDTKEYAMNIPFTLALAARGEWRFRRS